MGGEVRDERPAREITQLTVSGAVDVLVRRGAVPSLVVVGDSNEAVASVKTTYQLDALAIEQTGTVVSVGGGRGGSVYASGGSIAAGGNIVIGNAEQVFNGRVGQVVVTNGDLSARGTVVPSGRLKVKLVLPSLAHVELVGAGDINLMDLQQRELSVALRGAGHVFGTGEVESIRIALSGAGDVELDGVSARRVDISLTGAGDVSATATKSADVRLTGAGDVRVYGNPPERSERKTGVGRIRFR